MKFGSWIKAVRKAANMNQIEFAQFLGVSQSWVSKAEKDVLEPSATQYLMIRALARQMYEAVFTPEGAAA